MFTPSVRGSIEAVQSLGLVLVMSILPAASVLLSPTSTYTASAQTGVRCISADSRLIRPVISIHQDGVLDRFAADAQFVFRNVYNAKITDVRAKSGATMSFTTKGPLDGGLQYEAWVSLRSRVQDAVYGMLSGNNMEVVQNVTGIIASSEAALSVITNGILGPSAGPLINQTDIPKAIVAAVSHQLANDMLRDIEVCIDNAITFTGGEDDVIRVVPANNSTGTVHSADNVETAPQTSLVTTQLIPGRPGVSCMSHGFSCTSSDPNAPTVSTGDSNIQKVVNCSYGLCNKP